MNRYTDINNYTNKCFCVYRYFINVKKIYTYYIMPLGYPQDLKAKTLRVAGDAVFSGRLELTSTTNGFVVPNVDAAQLANLTNIVNGMLVYNTDDEQYQGYANGNWVALN